MSSSPSGGSPRSLLPPLLLSDRPPGTYGDRIQTKSSHHFRGISCQLGCLPVDPLDSKHETLAAAISKYQADAIALQEIGLNFSHCGVQGQWTSRMAYNKWFDLHCVKHVLAWNKTDQCRSVRQWGGTGILAIGQTAHHAAGSGIDPTNLGRWCWTRYRGSNGILFRLYSIYRPSDNSTGQLSVYAQHQRYLLDKGDNRPPRLAFLQDLAIDIQLASQAGEMIIVCGDINQDVTEASIESYFVSLGLQNLIFSRHPAASAPATYNRNTSQTSIDGVWASAHLNLVRGGYLDFDDFPGDHRAIWFDISVTQLFGHHLTPVWKPQACRLQLCDPELSIAITRY